MADEIVQVTKRLLGAVGSGDYETYKMHSDESLTAIEPETQGNIIEGLGFHKYFFDLGKSQAKATHAPPTLNTISSPHVRMLGRDHALISYVRIVQSGGNVSTAQETRVWSRVGGQWKNVHFHRSKL